MMRIAWADPNELRETKLDKTIANIKQWMLDNNYPGVWLQDFLTIHGWQTGGKQVKSMRKALERAGFRLEKVPKEREGGMSIAWIAYLNKNGVIDNG
jgi:hypothetical protein